MDPGAWRKTWCHETRVDSCPITTRERFPWCSRMPWLIPAGCTSWLYRSSLAALGDWVSRQGKSRRGRGRFQHSHTVGIELTFHSEAWMTGRMHEYAAVGSGIVGPEAPRRRGANESYWERAAFDELLMP
jgi:hypothetical protein